MADKCNRWTFPTFADLPYEIRQMIWVYAVHPLVVVTFRKRRRKFLGLATPLMSTCAESQRVVRQEFDLELGLEYELHNDVSGRKFGIGEATWIKGKRVLVLPEILENINRERMFYCPGDTQLIRLADSSSRFFTTTFTHSPDVAIDRKQVTRMIPRNVQSHILSRLLAGDQKSQAFALHILQAKMQGLMRWAGGYFEIVGSLKTLDERNMSKDMKKKKKEKNISKYGETLVLNMDENVAFIVKVAEQLPEEED